MRFTEKQFEVFEAKMIEQGYSKKAYKFKNESFGFWKTFHKTYNAETDDKQIGYQLAILIWDWREHSQFDPILNEYPYGVQLEFIAGNKATPDGRFDFSISDEKCTVEKLEEIAEKVYKLLLTDFKIT
jgi:hypothetical protein